MEIALIMCVAQNGTIGDKNQLPWHLPADMQRFKSLTLGNTIIMGRKTQQSIGEPLGDRENIVITKNPGFTAKGFIVAHSLDEALQNASSKKVFIIGGAQLFCQAQSIASKAYVTIIHHNFDGDTKYRFDDSKWKLENRADFDADHKNCHPYSFLEYSNA